MTVTVRPVPKRTYQNGIRPFRPVVPANNIRPYTIKTWRPPVPEPLPPAPLLGPKELLALGVLVGGQLLSRLSQLWGLFASRPPTGTPVANPLGLNLAGTIPASGNTTGAAFTYSVGPGTFVDSKTFPSCLPNAPKSFAGLAAVTLQNVVAVELQTPPDSCGVDEVRLLVTYATGATSARVILSDFGIKSFTPTITTQFAGPSQPFSVGSEPLPLPDGYQAPTPEVAPVPRPVRVPTIPQPDTVPVPLPEPETLPQPSPLVPTTPGPAAPPATAPQVPRRTVPLPLPGATPTKDGAIVPQAPATVAVTPPDAHFPVPGAPPVTGNGPRPTPEGIAQELGRLEQKLARLSDPGPEGPGDGSDRLQLISDLIGRLIDFATSMTAGGGYGLSSPCEVDENGERIVTTVNYPGSTNSLGVLSNKVDALAALIQVHKDLKQPNCKQAPAVGQPVTVNFVQVD